MIRREAVWVVLAGAVVGALGVSLALVGNPPNMGFCIACFERDIAGALGLFKPWAAAWIRPEILGILLGAFAASLLGKEFRPQGGSAPLLRFALAMFVMIGALAFLGCPLRMTLRLAGGDLNALVALFGFVAGIAGGVFLLRAGFDLGRAHDQRAVDGMTMPVIFVGLVACAVFLPTFIEGGAIHVGTKGHPGAGEAPAVSVGLGIALSLGAGLLVGVLAQRSRLCMAGGVRDMVFIRSPHLLYGFVAILAVALLGNLVAGTFSLGFAEQPVAHTRHLWNVLGMALVGLASVLLGGCPLRQLVLAGSGNSDSGLTIMGMLAGAAVVHNFGLAAAATTYAKLTVVLGLIVVIVVGFARRQKWE
jgi:YedE family putative selenium metabolism protein